MNRANTLRGREAIAAFFAQKRNIRLPNGCVIRAAYSSQLSTDPGLKFLIVVSKRTAKRAHDRNQLKRWVRAAIGQLPQFAEIDEASKELGHQLILLISPIAAPSKSVNWESIRNSVAAIAEKLRNQNSEFRIPSPNLEAAP